MLEEIRKDLRSFASPRGASDSAWFFKTGPGEYGEGDKFLGIKVPNTRLVAREYKNASWGTIIQDGQSLLYTRPLVALAPGIAIVLTVLALADMGLTNIWAKASNANHARILERIGATHVVFPEQRMGERTAHLLNERLLDFIAFDDEFAIARLAAPEPLVGLPLVTSACRKKYDVTVVGVKRAGEAFIHAVPDTIIFPEDELVVSGRIKDIERFSAI